MSLAGTFNSMATLAAAAFAAMFPDLCAVQRGTPTQGTSGGSKPAWASVPDLDSVPCLVSARTGAERDAAGTVTAFTFFEVMLPAEVEGVAVVVRPKDRLLIAARGNQPERILEVSSSGNEAGVYVVCTGVLRNG